MSQHKVVIVDDHVLFAKALKTLISSFEDTYVTFVASNGKEFVDYINAGNEKPNVVLLDVRMPIMDGKATMLWIKENHPDINVLAITMEDDEDTITRMIRYGCKGYLLKDVEPSLLNQAISHASQGRFVYSDLVDLDMREKARFRTIDTSDTAILFKEKDQEFLNFICGTDLTYKEIADKMSLSPKTIDNRRADLFRKLGVNTRIGAVLYAMEHRLLQ